MNKQKCIEELTRLVEFESVSADPKYATELQKTSQYLKNRLEGLGFQVFVAQKPEIPALIIAKKTVPNAQKTIGIYGHYDVQPEDPVEEWRTPPFVLKTVNGKFYGRGVADNKGHVVQNIFAIENLILSQSLKNNITFILEGEEEKGSEHFEELVAQNKSYLSDVDVFFITDTNMRAKNIPVIYYALRGYIGFELILTTGKRDLHSGVYGNQVYNPAQLVAELFANIKDSTTGRILIPHFYDDVRKIGQDETELLEKVAQSDQELKEDALVQVLANSPGVPLHLAAKVYPSCDIGGMQSGYTGVGLKNIVPRSATVKFSFRLVENQDPVKIKQLIKEFIAQNIPEGIEYNLTDSGGDSPFYTDFHHPFVKQTAQIMSDHFGNATLFDREGGSIPAAEILFRLFGKPIILTGFVPPGENMHAPNENYDEEMFWKGIEALEKIYGQL